MRNEEYKLFTKKRKSMSYYVILRVITLYFDDSEFLLACLALEEEAVDEAFLFYGVEIF